MKNLWLVVAALLVFVAPASATRKRGKRTFEWRPGRFTVISAADISEIHPMPTLGPILLDEVVVKEPDVKYNQPLFEVLRGLIDKNRDLEETAGETEDQQRPF